MRLNDGDMVTYLANVIFVAHADSGISPKEAAAIEEVRVALGGKKSALNAAMKAVRSGSYAPTTVGDFATQVINAADMLYLCYVDGEMGPNEEGAISEFCSKVGLTGAQRDLMVQQTIARVHRTQLKISCPACRTEVENDAKFCPSCGAAMSSPTVQVPESFKIPSAGYAIEFCESTAAGFPSALEAARAAPVYASEERNRKTWHMASWPESDFENVAHLAGLLSGMRNRKAYHSGKEVVWDELFGFVWCAKARSSAYRPHDYCFGKDDNQPNPWGCNQARMDWVEWGRWFSYGRFQRAGVLRKEQVWIFDKDRIRHEVMTNLHKVRFCPHLRMRLVEAVLKALPDQVEVKPDGLWKYSRAYEELPGSIKVTEVEKNGGFEFKSEYYADGVRPRGSGALKEVLQKAFAEAGIADVSLNHLVG